MPSSHLHYNTNRSIKQECASSPCLKAGASARFRVVTETGVENFTDFLPSELDDIEKLVGRGGLLQMFPPASEDELKRLGKPQASDVASTADRAERNGR